MDYLNLALSHKKELLHVREELHMHPELGNREFWTSNYIEAYLKALGLEVRRILDTAIVATLHGKASGKAVGLRADIDALPVEEKTGCGFVSVNEGVMHACGHDVHITAALGAARLLSENKENLNGDVVFLFQPDEECGGGSQRMIAEGAVKGVSAVFGGHVKPGLPVGTFEFRNGPFFAASDLFTIRIHGRSCHGSTPELGADALMAACRIIQTLEEKRKSFDGKAVYSVGCLKSGNACNIIADEAVFEGSTRAFGFDNLCKVRDVINDTVSEICALLRTEGEVVFHSTYSGVTNDEKPNEHMAECARSLFGPDKVLQLERPSLTTDDFGYFQEACTGAFCNIGTGCDSPLHSDTFLPDGMAAVYGAALYALTLENWLA